MGKSHVAFAVCVVTAGLLAALTHARPETPVQPHSALDITGTWKLVSSRLGNQERTPGAGEPVKFLHLTPTHFTRIVFDEKTKKLLGAVGGRYKHDASHYTEHIAYADENTRKASENDKSAALAFMWKLEGDHRLQLTLSGAQNYVEQWERAK
jgi:hypothetical protein